MAADRCRVHHGWYQRPLPPSPNQKDLFLITPSSSEASLFSCTRDLDLHRRPRARADALSTYLSVISILAKDKNHWGAREQGDD